MGIKKQADGTFNVSYFKRHPKTRVPTRIQESGIKTEAEAKRVMMRLAVKLEERFREKSIPKWQPFVREFYQHCLNAKGMTLKTADNYYACLEAHTFSTWGKRSIDTINTDEIRQLIKDRVGERSPSHQKNMLKFIRGVFTLAVERDIIQRNPCPDLKFRIGDKIKNVFTEEQVRILLNKGKEFNWEWYPHVATAIYTGMRNGELYALTWDKVNFDNRTILVDSSWNTRDGFKETKTGDDRLIEIAPHLVVLLKELKLKSSDSVFVLPRISKWDKGHQADELRMFSVALGLPSMRFHDLRATWATIMLSKGIEPAKVMVMGGWKNIKTLMVYLRKAGISIRGITNGLDLHDPSPSTNGLVLNFESK